MATFNGTLKYKQDDGAVVELKPVGVDSTARASLNNIATQIQLIEQTTGYNASPEDVPATSMKASINNLNTRVKKLEPDSFFIPLYGFCSETGANSCTIAVPKPAYLRHLEQKGYLISYAVSGGTVGNVLHFYTDGNISSTTFTPTITQYGDFIIIACELMSSGTPSIGSVVFGDYANAAFATSIKVTVSK